MKKTQAERFIELFEEKSNSMKKLNAVTSRLNHKITAVQKFAIQPNQSPQKRANRIWDYGY